MEYFNSDFGLGAPSKQCGAVNGPCLLEAPDIALTRRATSMIMVTLKQNLVDIGLELTV